MTWNFWICFLVCNSFSYSLSHLEKLVLYLVWGLRPSSAMPCSVLEHPALINPGLDPNHCYYPEGLWVILSTPGNPCLSASDNHTPAPPLLLTLSTLIPPWLLLFELLGTLGKLAHPIPLRLSTSSWLQHFFLVTITSSSLAVPSVLPHLSATPAQPILLPGFV